MQAHRGFESHLFRQLSRPIALQVSANLSCGSRDPRPFPVRCTVTGGSTVFACEKLNAVKAIRLRIGRATADPARRRRLAQEKLWTLDLTHRVDYASVAGGAPDCRATLILE